MSPNKKPVGIEKQESASKDKRMSQQRRQKQNAEDEENLKNKNTMDKKYLTIPVDEINAEAEADSKLSPSKQPCPRSPVKRMRTLEQKAEIEN